MGLANQFKTDPACEKAGVILDYGDARIQVARAGGANKDFAKKLRAATKQHQRAIQAERMDVDLGNDILRRVYSQTVITGWETRVSDEGSEPIYQSGIDPTDVGEPVGELLPPNQENIYRALTYLPDLFADIQQQASAGTLYRMSLLENESKN